MEQFSLSQSQSQAQPHLEAETRDHPGMTGDQQTLSPQIERLARTLVVPYRPSTSDLAADGSNAKMKTYVPLAVAMASSSDLNHNQYPYPYPYHSDLNQNVGSQQAWSPSPLASGEQYQGPRRIGLSPSGTFAGGMNQGGTHLFASPETLAKENGKFFNHSYNVFSGSYPPAGSIVERPMGRAFTLTPTPEPQGLVGPGGFSPNSQRPFQFAQQYSTLGVPPSGVSADYAFTSGASVSRGHAAQGQEYLIKNEGEDVKLPLETQVQHLHISQRDAASGSSMGTYTSDRAQGSSGPYPETEFRTTGVSPSLGSFNIKTLAPARVLFYFGVLTTQALLLPRFDFTKEANGKWSVKLTLYGHTLVKQEFVSQATAKLDVCRDALETLQTQYPHWMVPDEPHESETESLWGWMRLLGSYCQHNKIQPAKFTKYVHVKGYRYEVEVDGASYFGAPKSHHTEKEAMQAAAHMGFYKMLIRCLHDEDFLGYVSPLQSQEGLGLVTSGSAAARRKATSVLQGFPSKIIKPKAKKAAKQEAPKVGKKQKQKQKQKQNPPKLNSNLVPLLNRRIQDIDAPRESSKSTKWNITPGEIGVQIQWPGTYREKLEKVCDLLNLQYPEFEISQTDGRLVDNSEGEYRASAFFPHDPFLARVGPIGGIKQVLKDKSAAREACSKKVIEYLIHMVEEDTVLDAEVAAERLKVERWKENAITCYVNQGLMKLEEGEVLMHDV